MLVPLVFHSRRASDGFGLFVELVLPIGRAGQRPFFPARLLLQSAWAGDDTLIAKRGVGAT